jgi:hypothetical protein
MCPDNTHVLAAKFREDLEKLYEKFLHVCGNLRV